MFSKACEYAIKIMIHLTVIKEENRHSGLHEIAMAINSPEAFTAKILQQLVKSGLLRSSRGPFGGFQLKEEKSVTLADIVIAIDGDGIMHNCVLGFENCSEDQPCPMHEKFKTVREELTYVLTTTYIDEVKDDVLEGLSFLKR